MSPTKFRSSGSCGDESQQDRFDDPDGQAGFPGNRPLCQRVKAGLKFLTSVMVVPHRPAVLTAKILATIDVMSGGRLIVGVRCLFGGGSGALSTDQGQALRVAAEGAAIVFGARAG
jgi:hypothetical protein